MTLRWNLRVAMAERGIFTMVELGRRMADRGNYPLTPGLALDPHGQGVAGKEVLAWLEGRHEDALTHFRAFWSDGRERGDVQAMAYGLAALADYMLQLGRAFDAEAPAREAGAVIRSSWPSIAGSSHRLRKPSCAWRHRTPSRSCRMRNSSSNKLESRCWPATHESTRDASAAALRSQRRNRDAGSERSTGALSASTH